MKRIGGGRRWVAVLSLLWTLLWTIGCAAHERASALDAAPPHPRSAIRTAGGFAGHGGAMPLAAEEPAVDQASYDFSDDLVSGDLVRPDGENLMVRKRAHAGYRPELAQNEQSSPTADGPPPDVAPAVTRLQPAVRVDGRSGPLLIYEAQLQMAVYKVEETQQQAIAIARELGGFFSEHADRVRLVIRIPAGRFHEAIERLETTGEVTARHVRAHDVTDQYRDLEMRLRNAEAVRVRLLDLLAKATDVPQSLQVEKELDRVSERIERLKGQLQMMADRLAYSTITLSFQIKREESIDHEFQLPFEWLRRLGLKHLLTLS